MQARKVDRDLWSLREDLEAHGWPPLAGSPEGGVVVSGLLRPGPGRGGRSGALVLEAGDDDRCALGRMPP